LECLSLENISILYINSLRPSIRDGARVSRRPGPAHPVLRIFFQKICGFRAGISCSQSFLSKDLWFPSLAFKPTGPSSSVEISCSQSFLLKDMCSAIATPELQAHQQNPLPSMCLPFLCVRHEQASGGAPLLHTLCLSVTELGYRPTGPAYCLLRS